MGKSQPLNNGNIQQGLRLAFAAAESLVGRWSQAPEARMEGYYFMLVSARERLTAGAPSLELMRDVFIDLDVVLRASRPFVPKRPERGGASSESMEDFGDFDQVMNSLRPQLGDTGLGAMTSILDQCARGAWDDAAGPPSVVLVNKLLEDGTRKELPEIRLTPGSSAAVVSYGMRGGLRPVFEMSSTFYASVLARLKILAGLPSGIKKRPQEGKIHWEALEALGPITLHTAPGEDAEAAHLLWPGHDRAGQSFFSKKS